MPVPDISTEAQARALTRRSFLRNTTLAATTILAGAGFGGASASRKVDVCVYGGTSGGVIAAATLARLGRSVLVVEPTRHLGGMTSGGLGWIDQGRASTIGGSTRRFFEGIREYYSAQKIPNNGWSVEPHVAEEHFDRLITDKIEVIREARLASVRKEGRRIRAISLDQAPVDTDGAPAPQPEERNFLTVEAAMFLDCSYEGDLLAAAGVTYRIGREGRDEFEENCAGICYSALSTEIARDPKNKKLLHIDPFVRPGDSSSGLLPGISNTALAPEGQRSPMIQSCSFRLCLTKADPVPIAPPANYDPADYELVHRYLAALDAVSEPLFPGDLYFNFGYQQSHPRLLKITRLMRGKTDVNSGSGGISMDFVNGGAERYPNGSWTERAKLWRAHADYQRGYLYFLRTDERLPGWLREEISPWGLPKDEFRDSRGWPTQLYLREARRMVNDHVVDQSYCEHPLERSDSIGRGSYSMDSHFCQRLAKDGAVIHEGGFYQRLSKSYPIPFTAIIPRENECENLLAPFCVSATHVAFSTIRMEPPFMILSESAAIAADQALREGGSVQGISIAKLRSSLLDAGQIL
jgi:FAD dependent oxidoreductase